MVPVVLSNSFKSNNVEVDVDYREIHDFFDNLTIQEKTRKSKPKSISIDEEEVAAPIVRSLFQFDPNVISPDSLILLGLSQKQVAVVCNYRNKGGKFRTPADFAKIYSIDAQTHSRLLPYINIDSSQFVAKNNTPKVEEYKPMIVELNSADTIELRKIKGIGAAYARRIAAFRSLLGGFYSTEQLLDVYGMTKELYQKIQPFITLDEHLIKTININTISYEELREHPYVNDYEAKSIVYYRSKVGTIANTDEILKNKLLSAEKFNKLKPYLEVK